MAMPSRLPSNDMGVDRNNANDRTTPLRIPGNIQPRQASEVSGNITLSRDRNNVSDRPDSPLIIPTQTQTSVKPASTNSQSQTYIPPPKPTSTNSGTQTYIPPPKPTSTNSQSQTYIPPGKATADIQTNDSSTEIITVGQTFVRFGQEKIGDAVFEVSGIKQDIITGGLGFNGINEFSERFSPDIARLPDIKKVMIKYWKITNAMKRNMISEPEEGKFKVPCDKKDIDLLIEAFNNYKIFMERQVRNNPNTSVEDASSIQLNRIVSYLSMLNKGPNQPGCIQPVVTDDKVLYYSVLPKIFYLMYKNGSEGNELNIREIFKKYPTISQEVSELFNELTEMGPFKKDHDGVRAMAHSVVDLFNLLSKLFPDIYGKIDKPPGEPSSEDVKKLKADLAKALGEIDRIKAELAESEGNNSELKEALKKALTEAAKCKEDLAKMSDIGDVDVESILRPYLEFIKDPVLINGIIENIKAAHTDYRSRDSTAAMNKIGKAFALFKQIVDEMEKKVATASTTSMETSPPIPPAVQASPDSNNEDPMKSIIKQIVVILKGPSENIQEELNKLDLSKLNPEEQSDIKTIINTLVPNAEGCKPFIQEAVNSAKQDLYKQIIGHIRSMFDRLSIPLENMRLPLTDARGDTMRGTDVFEKLNEEISDIYDNNEQRIAYQKGMISIDDAIDTLGEYLIELENKYACWKKCFEKQPVAPAQQVFSAPQASLRPRAPPSAPLQVPQVSQVPQVPQVPEVPQVTQVPKALKKKTKPNWNSSGLNQGQTAWSTYPSKSYKGGKPESDVSVGPDDIVPVMAEQVAWENMMKHYKDLEPEYQQLLPEPEPSPIYNLTEPFHRYIDEYADEDPLEEARETMGLMSAEDIEDVFTNDSGTIDRVKPLFRQALKDVKEEWIPVMIRAEILRTVPSNNYMFLSSS